MIAVLVLLIPYGCSDSTGPQGSTSIPSSLQSVLAAVSLDRAQLSVAGVTTGSTKAVFSIGWKKFVGPSIANGDTMGQAYAIALPETVTSSMRPTGLDMGTVTLSYPGGSLELTKRIAPDKGVIYETFGKGIHRMFMLPMTIPFVANGVYTFTVTGTDAYSAGAFQITAPSSLLSFTGYANGDTVSASSGLTLKWTGGSSSDSVLVRIVPHLRPGEAELAEARDSLGCEGDHHGGRRPMGYREGRFMMGGPLEGMGPEFWRGIVVTIPNTGSYTLSAVDIAALLNGTSAGELMIGVSQVVKQQVLHDGGTTSVVLRSGDRLVLRVR
jgi:hypothetical protein